MARKMTEWPSKRGPITKIMPSDGCIGDTVPLAVGKWYDFHEFGWYMGNVGSKYLHYLPFPSSAYLCVLGVEFLLPASRKQARWVWLRHDANRPQARPFTSPLP